MAIKAVDLFCGAGGTSTGLTRACESVGHKLDLTAVNHWPVAVETHAANHPSARHLCASVESVVPRNIVPRGHLDLLMASPPCTHHSRARGGKPVDDQSRATAWHVLDWVEQVRPRYLLVENVVDFEQWGPVSCAGKPIKKLRGQTFARWLDALRSYGYRAEVRRLNAADYGDATTRERLFVLATRCKGALPWPEPTHCPGGSSTLFGELKPWRAAREIIDWTLRGESIAGRKRPLSENTLRRIAAGLRKFCGKAFTVRLKTAQDLARPLGTVTAGGENHALCEPFVMQMSQTGSNGDRMRPVSEPLTTVTTADDMAVCHHFLVPTNYGEREGQAPRTHSVDEPLPTVVGTTSHGVVQPFILPHRQFDGMQVDDVDNPLRTITALNGGNNALVEPYIIPTNHGNDTRSHSVNIPMPTITTVDAWGLIEPFLVAYYGTGGAEGVDDPLDTITARDRFGLVDGHILDIRFRMLQPHELAAAMGFPSTYVFKGNREQRVKQIGNAVAVGIAEALCAAILAA